MELPVLSVSEFNDLVNQTLESAYPLVSVVGEITDFKVWRERFIYFDLKDENSTVNCFMVFHQLKTPLEDGMNVRIDGRPKLTTKGRFSLSVYDYQLSGEGTLRRNFELLKAKLEAEGKFALDRKRDLMRFPRRVGLITAVHSAAHKDFIKIMNQRWGGVTVEVVDVQVQGTNAAEQIVDAIEYFNQSAAPIDILALVRGGGSLEDLQAFNTESVARAVAGSRTPTVVGVGHETDVSLADLVADVRASTPSNAAEIIFPERIAIATTVDSLAARLEREMAQELINKSQSLQHYLAIMERYTPQLRQRIVTSQRRISESMRISLSHQRQYLESLVRSLRHLDPRQVLKRGYAIAKLGTQVVKSSQQVSIGDSLMLQLARGKLRTEVKNVQTDQTEN